MDATNTEVFTFPFHVFGNLWLQDPSIFIAEADQVEMAQNMTLIQEFAKSRKYCRFFPYLLIPMFCHQ